MLEERDVNYVREEKGNFVYNIGGIFLFADDSVCKDGRRFADNAKNSI